MTGKRADLRTLTLLAGMYAILGANVALYYSYRQHPVVHVLIGALAIHLAFTIWHEAVHETVSKRTWVNNVVGVVGMLPYMTPYFMQKWVHLEHHRKLNREDDPNYIYTDGSYITLPFRYIRALRYANRLLKKDPRSRGERLSDLTTTLAIGVIYAVAILRGSALDILVLWFAPVVIAKLVMDWYVNYLPHVGLPPDRFAGTRVIEVGWFTPLVLGHNYHAVHHLWPTVPWHRYRQVYKKKLEYLKRHGVPVENRVFRSRTQPIRIDGEDARAR